MAALSALFNIGSRASSDNVAVSGYRVFRGGTQIATTTATTFSNTGLAAGTSYTYSVSAFDAAGNVSAQSSAVSATTFMTKVLSTRAEHTK